jgi:hypothetical protein
LQPQDFEVVQITRASSALGGAQIASPVTTPGVAGREPMEANPYMAASTEIADRIFCLEREKGRLIPADLVEDARDPDSPLHAYFTWDDTEAAEKYRLHQARTIIRSVKCDVTVRDISLSVVRYVRDPDLDTNASGYRNIMNIRTEEDSARATIIDEMKRVSDAIRRAKTIAAVLGVVDDLTQIDVLVHSVIDYVQEPRRAAE